jgi:hypothetical protein
MRNILTGMLGANHISPLRFSKLTPYRNILYQHMEGILISILI